MHSPAAPGRFSPVTSLCFIVCFSRNSDICRSAPNVAKPQARFPSPANAQTFIEQWRSRFWSQPVNGRSPVEAPPSLEEIQALQHG